MILEKLAFIEPLGLVPNEYDTSYRSLLDRRVDYLPAPHGGPPGDPKRIVEYSLCYRQIALHRSLKLFEATIDSVIAQNVYSLALAIRGHYESTAAIGYLNRKLGALKEGRISAEEVDKDLASLLLGTKIRKVVEESNGEAEAIQVLKLLDKTDQIISPILNDQETKSPLREIYEWLCEFTHPNFFSNQCAFRLNKEQQRYDFRHEPEMTKKEVHILEYLLISNSSFIYLYDNIETLLPEVSENR